MTLNRRILQGWVIFFEQSLIKICKSKIFNPHEKPDIKYILPVIFSLIHKQKLQYHKNVHDFSLNNKTAESFGEATRRDNQANYKRTTGMSGHCAIILCLCEVTMHVNIVLNSRLLCM